MERKIDSAGSGRVVTAVVTFVVVFLALYSSSVVWLIQKWRDGGALTDHGLAIAAISVILVIHSAMRLDERQICPNWRMSVVAAAVSFVWLLAVVANVATVHTTILPFLLLTALFAAFGRSVARQMSFAVLYILLAMPLWPHAQPLFQWLTGTVSHVMLELIGVSALIEGNLVHVAAGTFRIADGCSGVNYIVVGLAIASLYAYVNYYTLLPAIKLCLAALGLALIGNWIRVTAIIYIGNISQMQSPLIRDHVWFGWLIFALLISLLIFLAPRVFDPGRTGRVAQPDSAANTSAQVSTVPTVAILVCLAVAPAWASLVKTAPPPNAVVQFDLPEASSGWSGPAITSAKWSPVFEGSSGNIMARYTSEIGHVWLYSAVFLAQKQGQELVGISNDLALGMEPLRTSENSQELGDGSKLKVRELESEIDGERWLIWYWYEVSGRRVVNKISAKIHQSFASLMGRPEGQTVAIATICSANCESAARILREFAVGPRTDVRWRRSADEERNK